MKNDGDDCCNQACEDRSQVLSSEELAQYDYWKKIFSVWLCFLSTTGFLFGVGWVVIDDVLMHLSFPRVLGSLTILSLSCVILSGILMYFACFKMSRIVKIMLLVSPCMALLTWLWCLVIVLSTKCDVVTAVTDVVFITALFLLPFVLALFEIWYTRWQFKRLSREQYEKKMKGLRGGILLKVDAFLRRHPSLRLVGDKERFFNGLCIWSILLLPLFYIIGSRTEQGDWTIPADTELRIERMAVSAKDNMYTALMAITNLCHVSEKSGDNENCDDSDIHFVRSYGNLDDDKYKRNNPDSRQRARRILADNADFFPAFHVAVSRKGFAVTDSKEGEVDWMSELCSMAHLVSMKAQTALEDGNMDAALVDIKNIHALGKILASNDTRSYWLRRRSYEKMRNAVAMGVVTDEALIEFMKLIDDDDAAASANRELAIKAAYEDCIVDIGEKDLPSRTYQATNYWIAEIFRTLLCDKNKDIEIGDSLPIKVFSVTEGIGCDFIDLAIDVRSTMSEWFSDYKDDCRDYKIKYENALKWLSIKLQVLGERACIAKAMIVRAFMPFTFFEDRFARLRIRLILATEKWRRAHNGKNPETLDALVPEYIPAVPVDPYDEAGGKVKYDAEHGVVWSIGLVGYDYLKVAAERKNDDSAQGLDYGTREYAFRLDGQRISFLP